MEHILSLPDLIHRIDELQKNHANCQGSLSLWHDGLEYDLYLAGRGVCNLACRAATGDQKRKLTKCSLPTFFSALDSVRSAVQVFEKQSIRPDLFPLAYGSCRTFAEQKESDAKVTAENTDRFERLTLNNRVTLLEYRMRWSGNSVEEIFWGALPQNMEASVEFRLSNII